MHSSTGLAIRAKIVVLCRFFGRVRWRLTLPFPFPGAVYRAARQSGTVRLGKGSREGGWVRAPASRPSRCEEAGRENVPPVRAKRPASRSRLAGAIGPRAPRLRPGRPACPARTRGRAALQKRGLAAKRKACLRKRASPGEPEFRLRCRVPAGGTPALSSSPAPFTEPPANPKSRCQKAPAGRESTATEQTGRDRRTPPRKPHHRARHARPLNPINPPPPRQPATHRHTPPPPRQPATHHRHIPPPRSQSPRTFSPSVTNASCSVTGFGSSVSFRPPPVLPWWVPSA